MTIEKLKAYFWKPDDDEGGIAIIAETSKEAKKLGWTWWGKNIGNDSEYIDCRVRLVKNKPNICRLDKGAVDNFKLGLAYGLYGWIEDECDICHKDKMLSQIVDGQCICDECEEKA